MIAGFFVNSSISLEQCIDDSKITDLHFLGTKDTRVILSLKPKIQEFISLVLFGRNETGISFLFFRNKPTIVKFFPSNVWAKEILVKKLSIVIFLPEPWQGVHKS